MQIPYIISPRGMLVGELINRKNRLIKTAWINLVERKSLAEAAGIHVTAPIERAEVEALGYKLPEIFCIPNGVSWPENRLQLVAGPFANLPRPYALFLSRINWKKGLDRLISSWKWVPNLNLVIAGNDEENLLPKLMEQAVAEGVSDRVHFIGPASDEHKWSLYENAEMFVLPSYSENFGNVVAEAMAMGCPVVVTPEVGLAELVREIGAGIVTSGEPRALAQAIADLHADVATRKLAGLKGRQAAMDKLSWQGVAEQVERVYKQILQRRIAAA